MTQQTPEVPVAVTDAPVHDPAENRSAKDLVRAAISGWLGTALEFIAVPLPGAMGDRFARKTMHIVLAILAMTVIVPTMIGTGSGPVDARGCRSRPR